VTCKHKKRLGIKTIAAPDTPADVIEAAKARRRQRDQKYRHDQRRRLSMKPQAQSASQTKPWEALGMTRRTWYRRGKPTPETGGTTLSDKTVPRPEPADGASRG